MMLPQDVIRSLPRYIRQCADEYGLDEEFHRDIDEIVRLMLRDLDTPEAYNDQALPYSKDG